MPAPSITNLTQIGDPISSDFTATLIGDADDVFPTIGGGVSQLNGLGDAAGFSNEDTTFSSGTKLSAYWDWGTSYDISSNNQAIAFHFKLFQTIYHSLLFDTESIGAVLISGGDTANYGIWYFDNTNGQLVVQNYIPIVINGTPTYTGGSFDLTDITGFGLIYNTGGDAYGVSAFVSQFLHIDGPVVFQGGEVGDIATIKKYYDLMQPSVNNSYHNLLGSNAGPTYQFAFPISLQPDLFEDESPASGLSFVMNDNVGIQIQNDDYYSLDITAPANSSIILNNYQFSDIGGLFDFTIDGTASNSSIVLNSGLYTSVDNFTVIGNSSATANVTINSGSLLSPNSVDLSNCYVSSFTVNESLNPVILSDDLVQGSIIRIVNSINDALQFDFAPDDISDIEFILISDSTINHNSTSGTWILDITSNDEVHFDTLNSNSVTFNISDQLDAYEVSPSTGGGVVTLDNEIPYSITLSNLQNLTEVRVYDSSNGSEILGEENITTGEFTGVIPVGIENINISIVSLSYDIIQFNNLPVNNNISIPVQQQIDRWYNNP